MKTRRMGLSAGLLLAFACEFGHGPDDNGTEGDATSSAGRDSSPIAARTGASGAPAEAGTGGRTTGGENTAGAVAGASMCVNQGTAPLGGCVLDGDGEIVRTPVTAPVTVTAIADVMTSLCRSPGPTFNAGEISAKELRLAAGDGREWRAIVGVPSLPSAFFDVGDAFDLSVQAEVDPTFFSTLDQTFAFSREDELLFVLSSKQRFDFPFVPNLTSFGAVVTDAGMECAALGSGIAGCNRVFQRSVQITIGDASGTLGNGDTRQIGDMSFVLSEYYTNASSCDAKGRLQLAGFRVP